MLKLNGQDRASGLWQRIKRHLEDELTKAREENDGHLDQLKTERLRGRIACLKDLIEAGKAQPADEDEITEGGIGE